MRAFAVLLVVAAAAPLAGCSALTQPEEILIAPEPPKPVAKPAAAVAADGARAAADGPVRPMPKAGGG